MRKAAEALDDVAVSYRILQNFGAEVSAQRETVLLVRQIFGVPERQVEKEPELWVHRSIVTSPNSNVCFGSRQLIAREHARRAPERVSRKLIEQQHERQRRIGRIQP